MESVTHPRAGIVRVALPLQTGDVDLGTYGVQVEHRVGVVELAQHVLAGDLSDGVQRDHHVLGKGYGLQLVDQVVQADA